MTAGWVTPPGPALPRDDDPLYAPRPPQAQDDLFAGGKVKPRLGYIKVVWAEGEQLLSSLPVVDMLVGVELDYYVARAIDAMFIEIVGEHTCFADYKAAERKERGVPFGGGDEQLACMFQPSSDWRSGGYVIERYKVAVAPQDGEWYADMDIFGRPESKAAYAHGPTPLIAAMRCIVHSKFGDEAPAIYLSSELRHRPGAVLQLDPIPEDEEEEA